MKVGYIYILIDPCTSEIKYVGKTKNHKKRKQAHVNFHGINKKKKFKLLNWKKSLLKRGLKPVFEIREEVNLDELNFWEIYWISQLKTWGIELLNMTDGGDGLINPSLETRRLIGLKSKGRKMPKEAIERIRKANYNKGKIILVFNKKKEFVKEFPNARRCAENLNLSYKCISKCANGNLQSYGGYIFIFKEDNIEKILNKNKGRFEYERKVRQFDMNENFIQEHESITKAAKTINRNFKNIQLVCSGKRKSCGGYIWKYKK